MAADSTLVQGAYNVNKYRGRRADQITAQIGANVNADIRRYKAKKDKEKLVKQGELDIFNSNATSILDNPELNSATIGPMVDQLEIYRNQFIEAQEMDGVDSRKSKALISKKLQELEGDFVSFKENRISIAEAQGGQSTQPSWSESIDEDTKKFLIEYISPDFAGVIGPDGRLGAIGPKGEWISQSAIENIVEDNIVDFQSKNAITDLRNEAIKAGKQQPSNVPFDSEGVRNRVQNIIKQGNMKSIVNDPMFGNLPFSEELKDNPVLMGLKYSDLGIEAKGSDDIVSADDNLSEEDRRAVANAFIGTDDNPVLNEILEDYFVKHIQKNWKTQNNAVKAAEVKEKQGKSSNQSTVVFRDSAGNEVKFYDMQENDITNSSLVKGNDYLDIDGNVYNYDGKSMVPKQTLEISGGDVDEDGVYVPEEASDSNKKKKKSLLVGEVPAFRSRLKQDLMVNYDNVTDEEISSYLEDTKDELRTNQFNTSNFQQWLKKNRK